MVTRQLFEAETSWTTELLNGHAWVDSIWVRSQTLPVKSDRAYQPFVNL